MARSRTAPDTKPGRGKKVVAVRKQDEPAVINLMDALRQSLQATKHAKGRGGHGRNGKAHKLTAKRKTG